MIFFYDYVNININNLNSMLMNQGKDQKLMEDRALGSQEGANPQCFPQNMRKGCQRPFTSCKATPKPFIRAFLMGEWICRQAKRPRPSFRRHKAPSLVDVPLYGRLSRCRRDQQRGPKSEARSLLRIKGRRELRLSRSMHPRSHPRYPNSKDARWPYACSGIHRGR